MDGIGLRYSLSALIAKPGTSVITLGKEVSIISSSPCYGFITGRCWVIGV